MKTVNLADLSVRAYRDGDEHSLVELWESAHEDLGGYVPKSPEYWKWCVIQRPSVNPQDILLLEHDKRLFAYAVLARKLDVEGYSGTVLEFAVGSWLSEKDRRLVAARLISELENRSRQRGDELLNLTVPAQDGAVAKALEKAGFRAESTDVFQLVIVDLVLLLNQILGQRKPGLTARQFPSFRIALQPGFYRYCPYESVRIDLGAEPIVEASVSSADHTVYTDLSTLTDLIFRRDHFDRLLAAGKIKIDSVNGVEHGRELFQMLTLKSEWFLPPVDGR